MTIVGKLAEEFSRHIAAGSKIPFSPSPGSASSLSSLTRELEQKRQLGTLTGQEGKILRDLEDLTERIANFNKALPPRPTGVASDDHDEVQPPLVIPKISEEEAEKIISHLNEQFEQKVLAKLPRKADNSSTGRAIGAPPAEAGGRNLQDYLVSLRDEKPKLPFIDEDSHFDLSKLHDRLRSGQKN